MIVVVIITIIIIIIIIKLNEIIFNELFINCDHFPGGPAWMSFSINAATSGVLLVILISSTNSTNPLLYAISQAFYIFPIFLKIWTYVSISGILSAYISARSNAFS